MSTSSTLDDEVQSGVSDDLSASLVDNFTISFWAKARDSINFSQSPSTGGITFIPRAQLFFPVITSQRGLGFHLGIDGFSVVWWQFGNLATIAVQRQPLIGWHHYSIVYNGGEVFVYIDGANRDAVQSSKAIDRTARVGFRAAFGRVRDSWASENAVWGSGFEGWLSELRLANHSMHGSEALKQINNQSAWISVIL